MDQESQQLSWRLSLHKIFGYNTFFFGPPGTLNDINVLDRSPVFDDILQGRAPRVQYVVNRHQYDMAYYLTDGIYPKWSTFIQSITLPQGPKAELFAKVQEATRKDVERHWKSILLKQNTSYEYAPEFSY